MKCRTKEIEVYKEKIGKNKKEIFDVESRLVSNQIKGKGRINYHILATKRLMSTLIERMTIKRGDYFIRDENENE